MRLVASIVAIGTLVYLAIDHPTGVNAVVIILVIVLVLVVLEFLAAPAEQAEEAERADEPVEHTVEYWITQNPFGRGSPPVFFRYFFFFCAELPSLARRSPESS